MRQEIDREHGTSDLIGPWRILTSYLVTRCLINPDFILEARYSLFISHLFSSPSVFLSGPILDRRLEKLRTWLCSFMRYLALCSGYDQNRCGVLL